MKFGKFEIESYTLITIVFIIALLLLGIFGK